jgi:hypothetical protein
MDDKRTPYEYDADTHPFTTQPADRFSVSAQAHTVIGRVSPPVLSFKHSAVRINECGQCAANANAERTARPPTLEDGQQRVLNG